MAKQQSNEGDQYTEGPDIGQGEEGQQPVHPTRPFHTMGGEDLQDDQAPFGLLGKGDSALGMTTAT
jgi:hypothetical protein